MTKIVIDRGVRRSVNGSQVGISVPRGAAIRTLPAQQVFATIPRDALLDITLQRGLIEVKTLAGPAPDPSTEPQTVTRIAGANISGQRVLRALPDGTVRHATVDDEDDANAVLGVSLHSASLGALVAIRTFGPMEEAAWNWTPNQPLFLGQNGYLTQTPHPEKFTLPIGIATLGSAIFVRIDTPIFAA